jgi:cytochrome c biogenesis protein CcdA
MFDIEFLLILLPAAVADSINPCAFAILFVILGSILSQTGSYRKVLFTGLAFTLSIFLSYYLMGVGLYRAFAYANQAMYLQIWAAVVAILIWLANIKDYFWFGKFFTMEMPEKFKILSRNWLKKIHSPTWAFFIGILISLFLLPCTWWPYLTILSYLASESANINFMGYIYLLIYNLIFITPFVVITLLVSLWSADIATLKEYREIYKQEIHLVVWILMLWLWLYLLWDIYIY